MTLALALVLLTRQSPAVTLPVGTSPEFARAAIAVEAKLVDGDVAGAKEAVKLLPVRQPRLVWEESGLPPTLKATREAGLAAVTARWAHFAKVFAPQVTDSAPDIAIGFAPFLPDGPGGVPLASKVEPGTPLRATIGLTLGKPGVAVRPEDVNEQVAFVLGRYLGVPESPLGASAMHPDPRPGIMTFMPRPEETFLAARNLEFADRLRAAVEAGKPLGLVQPSVHLAKKRLDLGTVEQGQPLRTAIEVENLGAGPLNYQVIPDCSCFDMIPEGTVASQSRGKIPITINTMEYVGLQEKLLLFKSNDPSRSTIELPVTFRSRPAYRLFRPGGDKVAVPDKGGAYDYFLFMPPGSPIHVVSVNWSGMNAKVTWEPWTGTLADPDMQEGPLPRTGWRFRVSIPAKAVVGRTFGNLTIETDSPTFHTIMATLYAQKGIVADDVNLGDLVPGTTASLIVDRPNAPFKIIGVDAGPLKASWSDRRSGWEYRIDLKYSGGAPKGDLTVPIRIRTDDPKQPIVEAVATGFVK